MTKPHEDSRARTAPRFARCPGCRELIDAASVSCRFCGIPVSAEELEQSARMQEKLTQAKSKANDRASLAAAIKTLVALIVVYALWFLARFVIAYQK